MLLLRISISNTKEFFHNALQNFKSFFFCQGYQKLPKTPPPHNNHFSCSVAEASTKDLDHNNQNYEELEKFYNDFTEQLDSKKLKAASKKSKKNNPAKQEKEEVHHNNETSISLENSSPAQKKKKKKNKMMEKTEECVNHQRVRHQNSSMNAMVCVRDEHNRNCVVEKKLRELEMLELSDVDHVLDIEEVLHYYSRLTCPLYLEIVDKFFMEIYTEFFNNPARPNSPRSVNSKLKLRSLRS